MNDKFIQVIDIIKKIAGIKTDIELAKRIGMKQPNFAERKKKKRIPYKEIVNFCLKEGISLDKVFSEEKAPEPGMVSEPHAPYGHARFNELCKKLEKVLLKGNLDEKAKVLGIIEAVYNELDGREETEETYADAPPERSQKSA